MANDDTGHGEYVHKVRDETRRYIQDLLRENERLRRLATAVDSEAARLKEEGLRAREELLALRGELESCRERQTELTRRLSAAEAENNGFSRRYVEVEEHNNNLANLYVASYQLHETLERHEVVAAIQGIVVNLIGSEEFAILSLAGDAGDGGELAVEAALGVEPERLAGLVLGRGAVGRAAASGEIYTAADGADEAAAAAGEPIGCIPLKLAGRRVLGVIAIFRLLAHKRRFEALDYELFDLLATHAATALYVSELHARSPVEVPR